jgi:hypothetical protein
MLERNGKGGVSGLPVSAAVFQGGLQMKTSNECMREVSDSRAPYNQRHKEGIFERPKKELFTPAET